MDNKIPIKKLVYAKEKSLRSENYFIYSTGLIDRALIFSIPIISTLKSPIGFLAMAKPKKQNLKNEDPCINL